MSLQISHPSKPKQLPTNWQNPTHPHSTNPPHHQQIGTKPPTSTPPTTQIHVLEREKKKKTAGQPPIATHNPNHHHVPATQQTQEELTTVEVENNEKKKKKPRKFKPENRCVELTTVEVRLVMDEGEVGHGRRTHSIFGSLRRRSRCRN